MAKFLKSNYGLLIILLLAAIFRFWQIARLPGGLFPDEAANGLDVNSILHGHLQPFYERGNGREALFFYFLAFSVALFGRGPWQHHIVSAGFGFAAVLVTYFVAKRLFNKPIALLASFFMATSSYAVTISRTAFRANTLPLFASLTILFLLKYFQSSEQKTKIWSAVLAGISFGLGFYTYIGFRMMLPLLFGLGVLLLLANRGNIRKLLREHLQAIWVSALAFVASFAWIGYYFLTHPGTFVGRAGQVSIFSKDLNQGDVVGTFLLVFKKTIFSFFSTGDLNWRHNVSGYPFLSPFLSPWFAVGLLIFTFSIIPLFRQIYRKELKAETFYKFLVAGWFWTMLIPEVTTAEGIPHGLRLIGVMPPIFILAAWSVNWFWEKLKSLPKMYNTKYVLAIIFVSGIFFYNFALYFAVAASSPEYYYAFRSDLTTVSQYLNKRNLPAQTYLSLDKFSVQTVEYLTSEQRQPYTLLDPAYTFEVKLKKGDQVIFTQSTLFDRLKFLQLHPQARLVNTAKNQFGEIIMLVYQQP